MTTPEVLLDALNKLGKQEFDDFKFYLYRGGVQDFKPIPKGHLEDASKSKTVDLMVSHYDTNALIVAREVFQKMNNDELVRKISESIKEPTAPQSRKKNPAPSTSHEPTSPEWAVSEAEAEPGASRDEGIAPVSIEETDAKMETEQSWGLR